MIFISINEFEKDYNRAQKYISKDDIKYIKKYIEQILVPYIQNLIKQNPNLDENDIRNLLKQKANILSERTENFKKNISSCHFVYCGINHLLRHPELYSDIILNKNPDEVFNKNPELFNNYSFNTILSQLTFVANDAYLETCEFIDMNLSYLPGFKKILDNDGINTETKIKQAKSFMEKYLPPSTFDKINRTVSIYLHGIPAFLELKKGEIEDNLKENLKESIIFIANELKELNLFNVYQKNEYNNFSKIGLDDYSIFTSKIDLTDPKNLEDLSLYDLMILNSFWTNRYAKEFEKFSTGMFTLITTYQLYEIFDDNFDISMLNESMLRETLIKCRMLKSHTQTSPNLPIKKLSHKIQSRYSSKYTRFFNGTVPLKYCNNFLDDNIYLYCPLISAVSDLYFQKSDNLNSLILNLENIDDIQNAGIVPNGISEDGYSIMLDPNFVCLAFDGKLTFSAREHIKTIEMKDFLETFHIEDTYIRIYEGFEDFFYNENEIISSPLVLPFSPEAEKYIKKSAKNIHKSNNNIDQTQTDLILHLEWLRNHKAVPGKYKSEVIEKNGQKKSKLVPKYINIAKYEPGKQLPIYIKDSENNFILAKEKQIKLSPRCVSDINYSVDEMEVDF